MKTRKNTVKLAMAMVAALFLLGVSSAQAAMVTLDGDTATGILNLNVDGVLYNVDFVNASADDIYGDPPGFDFNSEDAVTANKAVRDALNDSAAVWVGPSSSPQDRDNMYAIGGDVDFGTVVVARSEYTDPDWHEILPIQYPRGSEKLYADFTPVPVPAAFWLFGSALGMIAWGKRRLT